MLPKKLVPAIVMTLWISAMSSFAQDPSVRAPQPGQYVPVTETYDLPIPITLSEGPGEVEAPSAMQTAPSPAVTGAPQAEPEIEKVGLAMEVANAEYAAPSMVESDSIPLPPRPAKGDALPGSNSFRRSSAFGNPLRTISSLGIVLGLFFLFLRFVRRYRIQESDADPLFDTLGRVSILGKPAHIVRFGSKLLVLAKTSSGLEKLTELSNPAEVEQIVQLCHEGSQRRLSQGLQSMLQRSSDMRPIA